MTEPPKLPLQPLRQGAEATVMRLRPELAVT